MKCKRRNFFCVHFRRRGVSIACCIVRDESSFNDFMNCVNNRRELYAYKDFAFFKMKTKEILKLVYVNMPRFNNDLLFSIYSLGFEHRVRFRNFLLTGKVRFLGNSDVFFKYSNNKVNCYYLVLFHKFVSRVINVRCLTSLCGVGDFVCVDNRGVSVIDFSFEAFPCWIFFNDAVLAKYKLMYMNFKMRTSDQSDQVTVESDAFSEPFSREVFRELSSFSVSARKAINIDEFNPRLFVGGGVRSSYFRLIKSLFFTCVFNYIRGNNNIFIEKQLKAHVVYNRRSVFEVFCDYYIYDLINVLIVKKSLFVFSFEFFSIILCHIVESVVASNFACEYFMCFDKYECLFIDNCVHFCFRVLDHFFFVTLPFKEVFKRLTRERQTLFLNILAKRSKDKRVLFNECMFCCVVCVRCDEC